MFESRGLLGPPATPSKTGFASKERSEHRVFEPIETYSAHDYTIFGSMFLADTLSVESYEGKSIGGSFRSESTVSSMSTI